jgi:ATP adenylyltransferase
MDGVVREFLKYNQLVDFISNRMRMSHIYQPVMLIELLRSGGRCSTRQIAKAILARDESQLEYYDSITNNMVGRILRKHGIVEKQGNSYSLTDYDSLSSSQRTELADLCGEKLEGYVRRRRVGWCAHTQNHSSNESSN